jgi:hypothetical protein
MAAKILIFLGLAGIILHWAGLSPTGALLCLIASLIVAAVVTGRWLFECLRGAR